MEDRAWRLLNGDVLPFDEAKFREMEKTIICQTGGHLNSAAHARADQGGLETGAELANVTTPVLVIEEPEDPINSPPHARHLASMLARAKRVSIPGMGHALPGLVIPPVKDAILGHTGGGE